MKILHIIHKFDPKIGGPFHALNNIIQLEKFLGYESEVLSSNETGITTEKVNYKLQLFKFSFPKRFFRSKELIKWLKNHVEEYDLFILHGVWTAIYLESAYFLMKKGKKYIIRPAGSLDVYDINLRGKKFLKTLIGITIVKKILNNSLFVFCTSPKEKEKLVCYGADPKVEVLSLPFNAKINQLPAIKSDSSIIPSFDKDTFKLLFISRLDIKKGLFFLFESINKLIKNGFKVILYIAGDGNKKLRKELEKRINSLNINEYVVFLGFADYTMKRELFNKCDLFVLPSYNENFGNVILEALSYNLPVLISDQVYIFNYVLSQNCGWVCEPKVESVYEKLFYIINNRSELKEKRENCLKMVNLFSISTLASIYKEKYESIKLSE